nr:agamous-like MADS-box protein AGL92 [Ipomoea trifida]
MTESERKRRIEKRKETLFKQAKELSVLCDVEVGIAMFSPSEGGVPIVWPSLEDARKKLLEFWALPEVERARKMVTHERVLTDWVNDEMRKMQKRENEVERKEMNVVMNQVIQGQRRLEEMDAREFLGLYTLANEKMQELEKRKQDLLKLQQNVDHGGSYCVPQPAPAPDSASWFVPAMAAPPALDGGGEGSHHVGSSSTNNGSGDSTSWFIPAMAAPPALDGSGEGSHHVGSSSTNNGGGGNYGHQLPDFDQVWPFNFPSSFSINVVLYFFRQKISLHC